MLVEVSCDKFIKDNKVRDPITFHKGLNVVFGNESGTNSIGKSTFMMILDFVFGGDDYMTKSREVHKATNVGAHTIKFKFVFDDGPHYFIRSTDPSEYKIVVECDENYLPLKDGARPIAKYNEFLAEHYGLTEEGQTWRGCVTRFIRVDRRETLDLDKPLKSFKGEADREGIIALVKLFGQYSSVNEQVSAKNDAEKEEKAFKDAQKYEYVPNVKGATEYKNNKARIETLEAEVEFLADQSSKGLLELTSMQAEQISEIKTEISKFRRQRTKLEAQLRSLEISKSESKKQFQKDYRELLQFFPNVNVERLEQVEEFHRSISRILSGEMKESKDNLEAMIALAQEQISNLEEEQLRISQIPNVTRATLERYSELQKELQILRDANGAYEKKEELTNRTKKLAEDLDTIIVREMRYIETKINSLMDQMNDTLYDVKIKPPILHVKNADSYEFYTEDDGGRGMRCKGVILLDLALLQCTRLPFVIHDSLMFSDVEKEAIEKIFDLYVAQEDKQVFIAFDKTATDRAMDIEKTHEVLRLNRGGNELFGRSWNRKDNKPKEVTTEVALAETQVDTEEE